MTTKTCTLCKEIKPTTEFTKHSQKKDGLNSWCKPCKRIKDKEAAAKRKKQKAEYDKQYRKENYDKLAKQSKQYRDLNKGNKALYDKEYRALKGQERLKDKRDYYHNRGGKEVQQKWQAENPELVKANGYNSSIKR